MATIEFTAFPRATEGRGASRRMRRTGKAPGIVYGGATAPQPIELDHNALIHALRNEVFHASILTMKVDGASTQVLLRDVQMHPFRNEVLHVDFQRIDPTRKIHMKVPLHFVNEAQSPAVKTPGRDHQPRDDRDRHRVPAEGPARVHRSRPVRARYGAFAARVGREASRRRDVVSQRTGDPVVATAVVPKAVVRDRGGRGRGRSRRGGRTAPAAKRSRRSEGRGQGAARRKRRQGRQEEVSRRPAASRCGRAVGLRPAEAATRSPRRPRIGPCSHADRWSRPRQSRPRLRTHAAQRRLLVRRRACREARRAFSHEAPLRAPDVAKAGDVRLCKPMTFMNLAAVRSPALARFFGIAPEEILVVHDELDLQPGEREDEARRRPRRPQRPAGHPAQLGSADYWRLRLGIGHPRDSEMPEREVVDYVLKPPHARGRDAIDDAIARGASGDMARWHLPRGDTEQRAKHERRPLTRARDRRADRHRRREAP